MVEKLLLEEQKVEKKKLNKEKKMNLLNIFAGETLGTLVLILLGNGVVANVLYKKTGGAKGGIIAITAGWGFAVFLGVIVANCFATGGHLNPAVTFAMLTSGEINLTQFVVYISSELLGATIGQILVIAIYWQHAKENPPTIVKATHCTSPTHRKALTNFLSEFIGTTVLVGLAVGLSKSFGDNEIITKIMSFIGPLSMALVVFSIGLSLGGTTGYAINPARDLMPRIVYQLTPYKEKTKADWKYSWIPVIAPISAGVMVGAFARLG